MSITIAIANQKGGVGKTTTTVNIAAALVEMGNKVLCVDLDPQANMSDYLGHEYDGLPTISTLMQQAATMQPIATMEAVRENKEGIFYIPSDIILSSADLFLATAMCREQTLKRILTQDVTDRFDYILIDCLPSLGILLTNALAASDSVLIPVQAQKYGYVGLSQLTQVIGIVQQNLNPQLKIAGIVLTMADKTRMSKMVEESLTEEYSNWLFNTHVHRRTEASISTLEQNSLISMGSSYLGNEYRQLAAELVERGR